MPCRQIAQLQVWLATHVSTGCSQYRYQNHSSMQGTAPLGMLSNGTCYCTTLFVCIIQSTAISTWKLWCGNKLHFISDRGTRSQLNWNTITAESNKAELNLRGIHAQHRCRRVDHGSLDTRTLGDGSPSSSGMKAC